MSDPTQAQVGGDHYKRMKIQPAEFVHANNIPYLEGSAIYYIARWRDKGGLRDIDKAIHTLQVLKHLELLKAGAEEAEGMVVDTTADELKNE